MEGNMLYEFLHSCIVTASQTAYMSHDTKTFNLLRNTDEVLLYFSKSSATVPLYNELLILEKYREIQQLKYSGRIDLFFTNKECYKNIFIAHMAVIGFLNEILQKSLDKYEGGLKFSLLFENLPEKNFTVLLESPCTCEAFSSSL